MFTDTGIVGLTTAGIGVTNGFAKTYTQQVDWFSTQEIELTSKDQNGNAVKLEWDALSR